MENNFTEKDTKEPIHVDDKIDVMGVDCPENYIKTKLKLEAMKNGQILEVTLDDGEPMRSVPRSIKEDGHQVIHLEQFEDGYKIYIKVNNN